MTIHFHPDAGTILVCNFHGMVKPEMVKPRPVVVISPRSRKRSGLCTIVPLSTTLPNPIMSWHCKLQFPEPLSPDWAATSLWVKCDMICTVRYERLDRFYKNVGSSRKYYDKHLTKQELDEVLSGISSFLGC